MNRFLLAAAVGALAFTSSFAQAERAKTASDVRLEERVRSQFSGPVAPAAKNFAIDDKRSEEHTSELQSH